MEIATKRVLVTGGNGFIGSHLVKSLVLSNTQVIVPYLEIDKKSFFHRQNLHKKTVFVPCDLRNFAKAYNLITKNKVDFIFHLAAQPIVEAAYADPYTTFETNIMGTVNVLEAARRYGKVLGILVTSSDKAYGKIPRVTEKDPVSGDHPYETSKSAADLIARTYFKTYQLPVVVTRFGNVYGAGDLNFNRIIPGVMESLIKKTRLEIRSDGKFVRDYVYVGDVVDAMIQIANNFKAVGGEVFNVSSNDNLSVLNLIKKIDRILKMKVDYKILNKAKNEIPRQSVDFAKIRRVLGWKPRHDLVNTLPEVFDWYKIYFES